MLDDGRQIPLHGGVGNSYSGTVHLDKDGAYHIAALDQGQPVRLSEDFFINARKADAPDIVISRPSGDYRASPIEEVTIEAKADDPFGLRDFKLHYAVNGGAEQTVNLLSTSGQKTADGSTVIRLEDFKAVPGDIVSFYATAKDAHADSRTDMFFIQAEPFEREYSQSQQAGGGGGGGGNAPDEISQRQKEIIGATWKQSGDKGGSAESAAQNAKFLSGVQAKLHDQAVSLANRLQMRGLNSGNEEFNAFQKDMNAAADAMTPAADSLRGQKWKDAIPHEQQALQYLLRAEATFRQIEVAFGSSGGANGGGAGRDLASLFDLELDTQKNQYETAQTADSATNRAKRWTRRFASWTSWRAARNNCPRRTTAIRPTSAGSRKCCAAKPKSCSGRSNSSRATDSRRRIPRMDSRRDSRPPRRGVFRSEGAAGAESAPPGERRHAPSQLARQQSQGQADARRAAQRLRDATNLLAARNASKALAASTRSLKKRPSGRRAAQAIGSHSRSGIRMLKAITRMANPITTPSSRSRKIASDLADDLAQLESQMRDAVRDLASGNHAAASKLRDALRQADQSNLDSRVQRSADMLRRGVNPDRNGSEAQIASDLQQLDSKRATPSKRSAAARKQETRKARSIRCRRCATACKRWIATPTPIPTPMAKMLRAIAAVSKPANHPGLTTEMAPLDNS